MSEENQTETQVETQVAEQTEKVELSKSLSEMLSTLETKIRALTAEVRTLRAENAELKKEREAAISASADALDFTALQIAEILDLFDDKKNDTIDQTAGPNLADAESAAEDLSETEIAADPLIDAVEYSETAPRVDSETHFERPIGF